MKNFLYIGTFSALMLLVTSCKLGTNSNTGGNFLNFEVIDTPQTSSNLLDEMYVAALSQNQYNTYNPVTKSSDTAGTTITLGTNDSLNVSINNTNSYNLATNSFLPNGFYTYTNPSAMNFPNTNSYKINLKYQGTNYSATLSNLPYVYKIKSATCSQNSANNVSCTISTSNTEGRLPAGVVLYTLNVGGSSICTGVLNNSLVDLDYVSFPGCQMSSFNNTITMQIGYNVPLTNVSNSNSSTTFNLQGQYYFVSSINVNR